MSGCAVVQTGGYGFRLERTRLKAEFDRAETLQRRLLRYTQGLMSRIAQTAACNRYHSIEQQLCRWLLFALDHVTPMANDLATYSPAAHAPLNPTSSASNAFESPHEFAITQELIAHTLGVRREGITEAIGKLQQAGTLTHRRGHVSVLNRAGLERNVCECYAVLRRETDRLSLDQRIEERRLSLN